MDIRNPIGLLFTLLGAILIGLGLFGNEAAKKANNVAETVNINLWWGVAMLIFGVVMLAMALLGKKKESCSGGDSCCCKK